MSREVLCKVGLEAEYLLFNDEKKEHVIPPSHWDRDGFPLLGEIRGKEGKSVAETITNFRAKEIEIAEKLFKNHSIQMVNVAKIPLNLYKKANREVNSADKNAQIDAIKNIYGTDITEFSDQILGKSKSGGLKIQGIRVSCGLHIHFSCGVAEEWEYEEEQYESVTLPMALSINGALIDKTDDSKYEGELALAGEVLRPTLYLFRQRGYKKTKEIKLYASRLNRPAIEYIVRQMDEAFFERFAPKPVDRTKYRQPGYFELKPYGFEYRSLPANPETMAALPEITRKAFDLLKFINEF
jgi:hypothetical protein